MYLGDYVNIMGIVVVRYKVFGMVGMNNDSSSALRYKFNIVSNCSNKCNGCGYIALGDLIDLSVTA